MARLHSQDSDASPVCHCHNGEPIYSSGIWSYKSRLGNKTKQNPYFIANI